MVSTRSVAVVPSGSSPVSRSPTTGGTSMVRGWPSMAASASIPPTPQPSTPRPLTMVVWESVPTRVSGKAWPSSVANTTRARYSRFTWWQMPGSRRHDPEAVEGLLRPAQQLVALDVALVLDVDVGGERRGQARGLGDDRVVDDQLDRHERVDRRWVARPWSPGRRAWRPGRPRPGTPVKSCMRTRSGVKAISVVGPPRPAGEPPSRPPPRCRRRGPGGRPRDAAGSRGGSSWHRAAGRCRTGPRGRRAGASRSVRSPTVMVARVEKLSARGRRRPWAHSAPLGSRVDTPAPVKALPCSRCSV